MATAFLDCNKHFLKPNRRRRKFDLSLSWGSIFNIVTGDRFANEKDSGSHPQVMHVHNFQQQFIF
jgi:hypothetical protein